MINATIAGTAVSVLSTENPGLATDEGLARMVTDHDGNTTDRASERSLQDGPSARAASPGPSESVKPPSIHMHPPGNWPPRFATHAPAPRFTVGSLLLSTMRHGSRWRISQMGDIRRGISPWAIRPPVQKAVSWIGVYEFGKYLTTTAPGIWKVISRTASRVQLLQIPRGAAPVGH